MNNPSYIATNQDELFEKAPKEIQDLILGDELNSATAILGKIYRIPISSYIALENIISFLLIGALQPENAIQAIKDLLGLSEEDAYKLATDLDTSILEKGRVKIFGKAPTGVVELTFKEGRSPDELRKEILDTTKRESGLVKEQASSPLPVEKESETLAPTQPVTGATPTPKKFEGIPGSRSLLLEHFQILGAIPDDDEITARLSKIHEQIASMDKKDPSILETKVPLQQFMFGEKGNEAVKPELKQATYSKAPTKYNVDPYRETAEES